MVQQVQPASCRAPQTCSGPVGGGICQRRPFNQHCLGPPALCGPLGWRLIVCLLGGDGIKTNGLAQGPLPVDSGGLQAPLGLGASLRHGVQRSPSQTSTSWWPPCPCTALQMLSQTCLMQLLPARCAAACGLNVQTNRTSAIRLPHEVDQELAWQEQGTAPGTTCGT